MATRPPCILLLLALSLAGTAAAPRLAAQRVGGEWAVRFQANGTYNTGWFGYSVAAPGDLDGDGVPDVLVGAPGESGWNGRAYAASGVDGATLWRWSDFGSSERGHSIAGAGDVNGDGRPDVVVGAPHLSGGVDGVVLLLHDGTEWASFEPAAVDVGHSVARFGDLNWDGFDDVLAGATTSNPTKRGSVFVVSGFDGSALLRVDGRIEDGRFGFAVAAAGDLDLDGFPDFLASAPTTDLVGQPEAGEVLVISGASGAVLHQLATGEANAQFGLEVLVPGDLDGDGSSDWIVAANQTASSPASAGAVYAYSSRDGRLLYELVGSVPDERLGSSLAAIDDVDFDGIRDLVLASTNGGNGGRVTIHSGATGQLLREIFPAGGVEVGSLVGVDDTNGDHLPEFLFGSFTASPGGVSRAGIAVLLGFEPYLTGDANALSASGGDLELRFQFPQSEAGRAYALLASLSGSGPTRIGGIDVPLTMDPVLASVLAGSIPPGVHGASGTLDGAASGGARIDSGPALSAIVGRTLFLAAVSYDAATMLGRESSISWPVEIVP